MSEDINQEILKELRKSRRSNQFLTAVIVTVLLLGTFGHPRSSEPEHSWTAVQTALRQFDYRKALILAQANVERQSSDYYGHSYLGLIYLAMGDVTNSESEYSLAYKLFPSEDNEKNLAAVRRRMTTEKVPLTFLK